MKEKIEGRQKESDKKMAEQRSKKDKELKALEESVVAFDREQAEKEKKRKEEMAAKAKEGKSYYYDQSNG